MIGASKNLKSKEGGKKGGSVGWRIGRRPVFKEIISPSRSKTNSSLVFSSLENEIFDGRRSFVFRRRGGVGEFRRSVVRHFVADESAAPGNIRRDETNFDRRFGVIMINLVSVSSSLKFKTNKVHPYWPSPMLTQKY
jgi:hypothetical protein